MGLQYGIKEVCNFAVYDFATNKPSFFADYAEVTTIETSGERTDMRAGQGNYKITSWDHSKDVKLQVTVPVVDLKLLAMLAGDSLITGAQNVFKREVLTIASGKVTLSETPLPNDIAVFRLEGQKDNGIEYTKTASAPTGTQFSISGKDLTFNASENGKTVVVYYQYTTPTTAQKISLKANKFPSTVKIFMDGLWREIETDLDRVVKITAFKAKPQPNFTLTMSSNDYTKIEMTFDLYAVQDTATGDLKYLDYVVL